MTEDHRDLGELMAHLDGAIAELLRDGAVAGWLAVQAAPFRNVFFAKQVGCWLLFTWANGSIEIEEDYPPFALLPELLAGTFRDGDHGDEYAVRWVTGDRRQELWELYGVHKEAGYYMSIAARHKRGRN